MMAHHGIVLAVILPSFAGSAPPAVARGGLTSDVIHGIQSTSPVCRKKSGKRSSGYAKIRRLWRRQGNETLGSSAQGRLTLEIEELAKIRPTIDGTLDRFTWIGNLPATRVLRPKFGHCAGDAARAAR
jgi:hypothetical protein